MTAEKPSMFRHQDELGRTFEVRFGWTPSGSSPCKGCKVIVLWVLTEGKRKMPLNSDGSPHWSTCPAASQFRDRVPWPEHP